MRDVGLFFTILAAVASGYGGLLALLHRSNDPGPPRYLLILSSSWGLVALAMKSADGGNRNLAFGLLFVSACVATALTALFETRLRHRREK